MRSQNRRRALLTALCFLLPFVFTSHTVHCGLESSKDIVELSGGEVYRGRILDAGPEGLLFASGQRKGVSVLSFERDIISKIIPGQYDINALYDSIGLIPSNEGWRGYFPEKGSGVGKILKDRIFDEIVLPDGRSFLGMAEIETPNSVFFSILLEKGIAIVELRRDSFIALQSASGHSRRIGGLYFRWVYLLHDIRTLIDSITGDKGKDKIRERTIHGWKRGIEIEEIAEDLEDMKVRDAAVFRKFIRWYHFLSEQQRHSLGVRHKYLLLGMSPVDAQLILGRPSSVSKCPDSIKEYWSFKDGRAVTFYRGRLIGYTSRSREKVLSETLVNFGDVIRFGKAF